jgi:hypothetical protein
MSQLYQVIQYRLRNKILDTIYITSERCPLDHRDASNFALALSKEPDADWPGCYVEVAPLGMSCYEPERADWYFAGRTTERPHDTIRTSISHYFDFLPSITDVLGEEYDEDED